MKIYLQHAHPYALAFFIQWLNYKLPFPLDLRRTSKIIWGKYPRLYHMADEASFASIVKHGLLSTSDLLDSNIEDKIGLPSKPAIGQSLLKFLISRMVQR